MTASATADTSIASSEARKRVYEGDDGDKSAKKQKKLTKYEQQEDSLREQARKLQDYVAKPKSVLKTLSLLDDMRNLKLERLFSICGEIQLKDHPRWADELTVLRRPIRLLDGDELSGLTPDMQEVCRHWIGQVNINLAKVASTYQELLESDTFPPSASNYAKPTIWPEWQRKSTAILNLRPRVNQGLPLSILHPVFARFRVAVEQPLPHTANTVGQPLLHTADAAIATRAAFDLCHEMAEAFDDEPSRRNAFEICVKPLFAGYEFRHEFSVESPKLERHQSRADLLMVRNSRPVLMGGSEIECGAGDAYMRLSRVYQTWINRLKEEEALAIPHGAPMILICFMGPLFIVAGGFFDGQSVLVEPLRAPCLMLPDHHGQRQEQLARVLLTTKEAVEGISQLDYALKVNFEPGLPRIYATFTDFEDQSIGLTFKSRLPVRTRGPNRNLLFLASNASNTASSEEYVIKLIADNRYGMDAHRKLAEANHAPTLFGLAKVEGAHTAYVMEYLSPADGWKTLHDYAQVNKDAVSHIQAPLDRLFEMMKTVGIVHGDLRPNNIMIRHVEGNKEPEIRVIDFDWAGFDGAVRYPLRRNEDLPWPGEADEPIMTGHDHRMNDKFLYIFGPENDCRQRGRGECLTANRRSFILLVPASADTSIASAEARKRGREGDDGDKSNQKQKKLTKLEQQEDGLREHAKTLKESVAELQSTLKTLSLLDDMRNLKLESLSSICGKIELKDQARLTSALAVLQRPIRLLEDDEISGLTPDMQEVCRHWIGQVNINLAKVASTYQELLESDTFPPSASNYAKPTIWPEWQQKYTAILNLRPRVNQGLPLSMLHPVFARFRVAVEQPLPHTANTVGLLHPADAAIATRAAFDLCHEMAEAFDDEPSRRNAFEICVKPLFAGYECRREFSVESPKLERHQSRADLLMVRNSRPVLMGGSEIECGAGDAYMRLSRVYQTWINRLKEEEALAIPHGAPMILICFMGPLFIVAGGFFDGKSVLVEPLTAPCLMLPDHHHQRQEHLARILFATKEAVEGISQLDYTFEVAFEPGLSRLYATFNDLEGQSIALTFKSQLPVGTRDSKRNLLFLASNGTSSQHFVVKFIADGRYGIQAHRKLAETRYAPILFGIAKVEGAPTAYVMEYLSRTDGWETLHDYAKAYNDVVSRIQTPLDHLLETMRTKGIVHGDLRPNNIMIRHVEGNKEPEIKVIDFDWAGFDGAVRYPLRRNEDLPWPGEAGEPIMTGHDRILLMASLPPGT